MGTIIDYDVWAISPSTGQEKWPENPRSAITDKEAEDQSKEFVEKLKKETKINDWQGKWKKIVTTSED